MHSGEYVHVTPSSAHSGEGAIQLDPAKFEMIMEAAGQSVVLRVVDETIYIQILEKDRAEMDGKS